MDSKKMSFYVTGGQINIANDNAVINATQNNGISGSEIDDIIKGILEYISELNAEDAERIADAIDMIRTEFEQKKPRGGRLKNCMALLTPMLTIANGIPTLVNNLQRLIDYINAYIS